MIDESAMAPLVVSVEIDGSTPEELAERAIQLRRELLGLDLPLVELQRETVTSDSAKGLDLVAAGALIIKFGQSAASLRQIFATVRGWLRRGEGRHVQIRLGDDVLELSNADEEQQRRLIDTFIQAHAE